METRGPPSRKAHGAVIDAEGCLWVVGGASRMTNSYFTRLSDVWMWDNRKATWKELRADGLIERQEHRVFIYKDTLMVVSGGTGSSSIIKPPLVQIYHKASNKWQTLQGNHSYQMDINNCTVENEEMVPAKSQSALIGDKIYFVGGLAPLGTHYSTDCYCLDLTTQKLKLLETKGSAPSSRYSEICAVGTKIYLFSGIGSNSYVTDDKLYVLDTEKMTWSVVSVSGSPPMPRIFHSITSYKKKIYVFGGQGYNDLLEFDTVKKEWTEIPTTGEQPTPRMCCTINVTDKFIFLFGGGANATDPGCDELLVLDRESNQWARLYGKGLPYVASPGDRLDVGLVLGDITQQILREEESKPKSIVPGTQPEEAKLDLLKLVFGDSNPFTSYTPFADVKSNDSPPPYKP